MHATTDIYVHGIQCTKPRTDVYDDFMIHIGISQVPDNAIIARVENTQLTIVGKSNNTEICSLSNLDNNYFNYSSDDFKNCLKDKNGIDIIQRNLHNSNILWCIRYVTLYLIKEKIQIWNQIPELNKYLLDEDLYDFVDHKPTERSIIFSGTKDNIQVEVYDPDDPIINMKFRLNYQSKCHLVILFGQILSSFNEENIVKDVEFICKNYLGANFTEKGSHNLSSIDYLLYGYKSDIFNTLYRICKRCLLTGDELLQY